MGGGGRWWALRVEGGAVKVAPGDLCGRSRGAVLPSSGWAAEGAAKDYLVVASGRLCLLSLYLEANENAGASRDLVR
jgi:hypothetical protein